MLRLLLNAHTSRPEESSTLGYQQQATVLFGPMDSGTKVVVSACRSQGSRPKVTGWSCSERKSPRIVPTPVGVLKVVIRHARSQVSQDHRPRAAESAVAGLAERQQVVHLQDALSTLKGSRGPDKVGSFHRGITAHVAGTAVFNGILH